ncbi:MAG TPA: SIS domain-containing protein [Acidimicrobiales bacterium]|nr:SIS domain-containing protein [Acidimicrobiales bacterium]
MTRLDTLGMWDATLGLPEQVAEAIIPPDSLDLPSAESIEHVVVLGAGPAGLAGDAIVAAAGPLLPLPVVVVRSYIVPPFVSRATLVFALSADGDTEEVVEAAQEAAIAGATVVGISGPGRLAALCREWGSPLVSLPPDLSPARAAIGDLLVPALCLLEDVGLFPGARAWVYSAVEQLLRRRDKLARPANDMEVLARRIGRTFPVAHGGGNIGDVAAHRFKSQVNANAKAPAFFASHPDLDYDELLGWGQHGDVTRQLLTLVNFRHDEEHPQVSRRFDLVADQVAEAVAGTLEIRAEGEGDVAQLLDLIFQGDICSLHLADQEGLDPGPSPAIDALVTALQG